MLKSCLFCFVSTTTFSASKKTLGTCTCYSSLSCTISSFIHEKKNKSLHGTFYFVTVNCFHSFVKCIVQWKIKYSKWNGSVVKRRFYIPKFWVFCGFVHFLYSPIPMPLRTIFPRFDTFLDNAIERARGEEACTNYRGLPVLYMFLSSSVVSQVAVIQISPFISSLSHPAIESRCFWFNPYPTAFPYGNGMVLHFYQQQESSTTKTVHKVINKGLKTYV